MGKVVGILERDWTLELEDPVANPSGGLFSELSDLELFSNSKARLAHFTAGLLGEGANRLEALPNQAIWDRWILASGKQNWFPLQELQFFKRTEAL